MTTTTTARYRAQTDPSTKTVHIGSASRDNVCLCGIKLITADDTRPFALKVPADQRHYTTGPDLATATCRACKRSYAKATAAPLAEAAASLVDPGPHVEAKRDAEEAARPSRRRARTGDPRADRAAADLAAAADRAAVEPRRRPSRADRARARQEEDRVRREAEAAGSAG